MIGDAVADALILMSRDGDRTTGADRVVQEVDERHPERVAIGAAGRQGRDLDVERSELCLHLFDDLCQQRVHVDVFDAQGRPAPTTDAQQSVEHGLHAGQSILDVGEVRLGCVVVGDVRDDTLHLSQTAIDSQEGRADVMCEDVEEVSVLGVEGE